MSRAPYTLEGPYRRRGMWDRLAIPVLAVGVALVFLAGLWLCVN